MGDLKARYAVDVIEISRPKLQGLCTCMPRDKTNHRPTTLYPLQADVRGDLKCGSILNWLLPLLTKEHTTVTTSPGRRPYDKLQTRIDRLPGYAPIDPAEEQPSEVRTGHFIQFGFYRIDCRANCNLPQLRWGGRRRIDAKHHSSGILQVKPPVGCHSFLVSSTKGSEGHRERTLRHGG